MKMPLEVWWNLMFSEMLETLRIDYLGVSLDALLIVAPPEVSEEICSS